MSVKVVKKNVAVKGSKPMSLNVDEINVDPSYQRGVVPRHKRIISNFNPAAMGRIVVGKREDGTLWVVDGQQRLTALKAMGKKTIEAEVFASEGPEHEAVIFKLINKNRTALSSLEIYHALLAGQDKMAWDIKEVVERCGFRIPKSTGLAQNSKETVSNSIVAVAALQQMYRAAGGKDGIEFVLTAVKQIWNDDPLRVREVILAGMHAFWLKREGGIDMDRLVDRLGKKKPSDLMYSSGMGVGSRTATMAEVMEKLYRKHK